MKTLENKKKVWTKPEVHTLSIKKDTFSGASTGNEHVTEKGKIPIP